MKRNYQKELEKILAATAPGELPKLLLHCCCAPCGSYVLEYLAKHFEITLFYYNPNIQPEAEYEKRLAALKMLLNSMPLTAGLIVRDWRGGDFRAAVCGLEGEPEGGRRCEICFRLRLLETAKAAKTGSFDYFCTTLTVSPHKNAERINAIGEAAAGEFGVKWLPSDFKKRGGYLRSVELSKGYGLYRQEYCGCR